MTSLQMSTLEDMRKTAASICRDYLTGSWKVVNPNDLIVKRISGGFSNYLYYVSLPDHVETIKQSNNNNNSSNDDSVGFGSQSSSDFDERENSYRRSSASDNSSDEDSIILKRQRTDSNGYNPEPREVLIRIYGQTHGEDALESMITESVVFALLSERNFGPKLHGLFPGGRIEQYINARPLTTLELGDSKITLKVAEKMAEIHSLNIPMCKEPDWSWNCMRRWYKSIKSILKKTDWKKNELELQRVRAFDFEAEVKWLKNVIDEGSYPVVFCHNDFQEGNILMRNDIKSKFYDDMDEKDEAIDDNEPELIVIDFEYCAYNYRGFDLANHFIEWTLPYNNPQYPHYYHHPHAYPTIQQQRHFIETYLRRLNESTLPDYEPSEEEIQNLLHEIAICSMLSHLFWTFWSVVNVTSNIEFGYWEYSVTRMQEYLRLKEAYIKDNKNNNNNNTSHNTSHKNLTTI